METVKRGTFGTQDEMPSTDWGIQDFYSLAQRVDFARLHQFRIVEWKNHGEDVFDNKDFFLYLETATLPGKEVANLVVPYIGMEFNVPGQTRYTGTSFAATFRCDQFYIIRKTLEQCVLDTFNDEDTTGEMLIPNDESIMIIALLDKNNDPTIQYKLIGANISNTGSIQYNLGDSGQIAKVEAVITYHYWRQIPTT